MISVKVQKNSLPEIIRKFPVAADRLLMDSIHRLHTYAIQEAPYRTGTLVSQHYVLRVSGGWQLKVQNVPYAKFVYFGTKPHIIRPRNPNGYLAFRGRSGQMVFTKMVRHPGTKPNKWIDRAVVRERPNFERAVKDLADYITHL